MFAIKTVIITDAPSGTGKAIATPFLYHGANIVINARNKERLDGSVEQNVQLRSRFVSLSGDRGLKNTGQSLLETALNHFGKVDVQENNAGKFVPTEQTFLRMAA